jgi:hypothetical protein
VTFASNDTSMTTNPRSVDARSIRAAPTITSPASESSTRSAKSLSIAAGAIHGSSGSRFPAPRISWARTKISCASSRNAGSEK